MNPDRVFFIAEHCSMSILTALQWAGYKECSQCTMYPIDQKRMVELQENMAYEVMLKQGTICTYLCITVCLIIIWLKHIYKEYNKCCQ